jgi:hypothetical protein
MRGLMNGFQELTYVSRFTFYEGHDASLYDTHGVSGPTEPRQC